ncbi:histone deacetylase [Coleofasciculus sp. FACHB-501]|uniref:histone deacetylase family protein n=1 Tax=Cyanophyceae TaxID=3028117 RepID=UPI00168A2EB4|nr:histone deacetylase [Coleofasciculus sp. FACHB-501]MBD1836962.1 histone deacetylase [Coleofasciculus sp. FACHB-501]
MITIFYSDKFLQHETGYMHPDQPERLTAIVDKLRSSTVADQIRWLNPSNSRNVIAAIEQIHSSDYIQEVRTYSERGWGCFESTQISPQSFEVACLAVSAWLDGIDVVSQLKRPAFVLARPPGHHALKDEGMGFCIFCNAAIAAIYAQSIGIQRVGILDWDVHHGNGTQTAVENIPNMAFCSIHQSPGYPRTGKPEERGKYNNVLNLPIAPGSNIQDYCKLFEESVIPFFKDFCPDILIISAGYDANQTDLLSKINLQPQDYSIITDYCLGITPKILFGLEGGYELESLSSSVLETVKRCVDAFV